MCAQVSTCPHDTHNLVISTKSEIDQASGIEMSRSTQTSETAANGKLRVVCLHGFSCNANIMKFQTSRLRKYWSNHLHRQPLERPGASPCRHSRDKEPISDVEFIFLESPRELNPSDKPLQEVTSLFPGPYRSWFEPHPPSQYGRRHDAQLERWLIESIKSLGHVDGVLAFSDGGALISSLTMKAEMGLTPLLWDFVVLVCAVDPYADPVLHCLQTKTARGPGATQVRMKTPSVHVIGLRDHVYRDRNEVLWELVHPHSKSRGPAATAELYHFDDGHKVPTSDTDLMKILSAWRRSVVAAGLYRDNL